MRTNPTTKKKEAAPVTKITKSKKKAKENADMAEISASEQANASGSKAGKPHKKLLKKPKAEQTADETETAEVTKSSPKKPKSQPASDIPRTAEQEKKTEKRKAVKEEDNDEELPQEDIEDGVGSDSDNENSGEDDDLMNDEAREFLDFEFEAFPMEEDDREGIVNMLTQIFLRASVDTVGLANAIIKQAPFGTVIGPAENEDDDEEDSTDVNVVYGVLTAVELNPTTDDTPKYVSDVIELISTKANKFALKSTANVIKEHLQTRIGVMINERMLNFPSVIVAPAFNSLRADLEALKKNQKYKQVLYIHKIRIADEEKTVPPPLKHSAGEPAKKKKKMGKAEKKRLAAESNKNAEILYDNPEDSELLKLTDGVAHHFDYPVYQDVEVGSKFHITRKGDKTYKPYRRVVLMDAERFVAFVTKLASSTFNS